MPIINAAVKLLIFQVANSIHGSYKDQYYYGYYGGQSTGSGSGNTIGSHNAQSD